MQQSQQFQALTLRVEMPRWAVGTEFTLNKGGKSGKYAATVIGYHIEHDTDTGETKAQYRISYTYCGQTMTAVVPRSTVDRAMFEQVA